MNLSITNFLGTKKARSRLQGKEESSIQVSDLLKRYLRQIPTLILGMVFSVGWWFLITTVQPDQIKHLFFPNSFFPAVLLTFLSIFFMSSFLLLHSRRGFLVAFITTIYLWLRASQTVLPTWLLMSALTGFGILELCLSGIDHYLHATDANLKQQTQSRKK